nr:hypothetical protein [Tanacetum cinerariifolium]
TDILAATRYPNGGGVATVSPSSKGSVFSEAETELYRAGAGTQAVAAPQLEAHHQLAVDTLGTPALVCSLVKVVPQAR